MSNDNNSDDVEQERTNVQHTLDGEEADNPIENARAELAKDETIAIDHRSTTDAMRAYGSAAAVAEQLFALVDEPHLKHELQVQKAATLAQLVDADELEAASAFVDGYEGTKSFARDVLKKFGGPFGVTAVEASVTPGDVPDSVLEALEDMSEDGNIMLTEAELDGLDDEVREWIEDNVLGDVPGYDAASTGSDEYGVY